MRELTDHIKKKMERGMPGMITPEEISYLLALVSERDEKIKTLRAVIAALMQDWAAKEP
jgi:hypothetical protein